MYFVLFKVRTFDSPGDVVTENSRFGASVQLADGHVQWKKSVRFVG